MARTCVCFLHIIFPRLDARQHVQVNFNSSEMKSIYINIYSIVAIII